MTVRLQTGDAAPLFSTTDVSGKPINLKTIDSKHILLAFFRYSGCPWCNLAVHRLALEYDRLREQGCTVIAFVQSEKLDILNNIYKRHEVTPPFPIVADPAQKYYRMYGVTTSLKAIIPSIAKLPDWVHSVKAHGFTQAGIDGEAFMVPAAFVINGRSKEIEKAAYGSSFYDHDAFVDIYESVIFTEL